MSSKEQTHSSDKATATRRPSQPITPNLNILAQQAGSATTIQRARLDPSSLTASDVQQLQRMVGNKEVVNLLTKTGLGPVAVAVMRPVEPTSPNVERSKKTIQTIPEISQVVRQGDAGGVIHRKIEPDKLNIVGENHEESGDRRREEKTMVQEKYGFLDNQYWQENNFQYGGASGVTRSGDSLVHLVLQSAAFLLEDFKSMKRWLRLIIEIFDVDGDDVTVDNKMETLIERMEDALDENVELELAADKLDKADEYPDVVDQALDIADHIDTSLTHYIEQIEAGNVEPTKTLPQLIKNIEAMEEHIQEILEDYNVAATEPEQVATQIVHERSLGMYMAAEEAAEKDGKTGVWKVGQRHADDLRDGVQDFNSKRLTMTSETEFNAELKAWQSQ